MLEDLDRGRPPISFVKSVQRDIIGFGDAVGVVSACSILNNFQSRSTVWNIYDLTLVMNTDAEQRRAEVTGKIIIL